MHKRQLHHYWVKLRPISAWYFLVGFILCGAVSLVALRQNNLMMIRLHDAVMKADESGEGVEEALQKLREHVYTHMNTDLTSGENSIRPPIQLSKTFERLAGAEHERVAAFNQKVSEEAETTCERQFPAGQLSNGRVQCVQEYITKNSIKERAFIKELYQFDFVSPRWTPDFAGWSLLAAIIFLVLFGLRIVLGRWLKFATE